MMSVTVKVTNVNEPGAVALSSVQPRVPGGADGHADRPRNSAALSGVIVAMVVCQKPYRRHLRRH